jgi:type IX secretion system PorP/SprF family membrane protein
MKLQQKLQLFESMSKMKNLVATLLILCSAVVAKAQDPHFSQFFSSPLTLSPAFTGKFDGTLRVAGNYRNQWPAFNNAYTTSTLSIDFPILQSKLPEYDTWGLGFIALNDQAGAGVLTNNYFGISSAYHKALTDDGFKQLSAGFQAVYGQKRLDFSKLYFEDQLTSNGFDLSVPSADIATLTNPNIKYIDVNAGVLYSASTNDKNNFYAGISMYHINSPKVTFTSGYWNVSPRTTITAGGYFPVSDILTFHTSGIFQSQARSTETTLGAALSARLNNSNADDGSNIYFGTWMRISDAIIPYLGLEFKGMRFGASYDVNTSSLKSGTLSRGGMEISLIYIKQAAGSRGIPCPKF